MSRFRPEAEALYEINSELIDCGAGSMGMPDHKNYLRAIYSSLKLEMAIDDTFRRAGTLLADFPTHPASSATHELTRRMLAYSAILTDNERAERDTPDRGACALAELYFAKSFTLNRQRLSDSPDRAATILFDDAGEPFAYQKMRGTTTSYVWRDATMSTQNGLVRHLAAGSIVKVKYDGKVADSTPHLTHKDKGLIAAQTLRPPRAVEFLRFALNTMPYDIRNTALQIATAEYPDLAPYDDEAWGISAETVGQQVMSLLQNGYATAV